MNITKTTILIGETKYYAVWGLVKNALMKINEEIERRDINKDEIRRRTKGKKELDGIILFTSKHKEGE